MPTLTRRLTLALLVTLAPLAWSQLSLVSLNRHASVLSTGGAASELVGPPFTITGNQSINPSQISADGRYVVFQSEAPNLVSGIVDGGARPDVFVLDRTTAGMTLVSRAAGQTQSGNGTSLAPSISADGQYVAFVSSATDLVPGLSSSGSFQVFLWSRASDSVALVSHAAGAPTAAANNSCNGRPSLSADGRFVAYLCRATNLVTGQNDTNAQDDAFLYDRNTQSNALVSHAASAAATAANARTFSPVVSANGARVAFESSASNLVTGQVDSNLTMADVFLYEVASGQNVLVSHALASTTTTGNDESGGPALSADGLLVAFASYASNLVSGTDLIGSSDVFLFDAQTGSLRLVSHRAGAPGAAAGESYSPAIDATAATIAYASRASDLVPGQVDPGLTWDVFLWRRATDATALVTHLPGAPTNAAAVDGGVIYDLRVSSDGSHVLYGTNSSALTTGLDQNGSRDYLLYDGATGQNQLASSIDGDGDTAVGACSHASLSSNGSVVVYDTLADNVLTLGGPVDLNNSLDVFAFDAAAGVTTLASARAPDLASASAGGDSHAGSFDALSADGRYAVFVSDAPDLLPSAPDNQAEDVFLADLNTGEVRLVSHAFGSPDAPAPGRSYQPALSADGSRVAFLSDAAQALVPGLVDGNNAPDVFLWERATGAVRLVTRSAGNPLVTANGAADTSSLKLSADGRFLSYASKAVDLVTGQVDANNAADAFLFDADSGQNTLLSRAAGSTATTGDGASTPQGVSADGRYVVWRSGATNLVAGQNDVNGQLSDVFLYDRVGATTTLVSQRAGGPATTTANGSTWNAVLSADGSTLALVSTASDLMAGFADGNGAGSDVYLYARASGALSLASHAAGLPLRGADGSSTQPALSADGQWLSYLSDAHDLVAGQTGGGDRGAFLYSAAAGTSVVVSHRALGTNQVGEGGGGTPSISADGSLVTFASYEDDVVLGQVDRNGGNYDVFLWRRADGVTRLLSRLPLLPTATGNGYSFLPALAASGSAVLFHGGAEDLVPADFNARSDVFVAWNESTPPHNPSALSSTTHALSTWSSATQIHMIWSGAADAGSGLSGYSVSFDTAPTTTPDTTVDVPHATPPDPQTGSSALADGTSHYFHLRTCDRAGNCSDALHRGPYWIDATPPGAPGNLTSTSHTPGVPSSDTTVDVTWSPAADATAGIDGYGVAFYASATPPTCLQVKLVEENVTSFTSLPLSDGNQWAHVCARDNAGNWGPVTVAGPYRIATQADLGVGQSASPEPVSALGELSYTLTVTNHGGQDASGVVLTDTLPSGLVFVSSTPGAPTCQHASGVVTCALGALPYQASANVVVRATNAPGFVGLARNRAAVTGHQPDANATNDVDLHDTRVVLEKGDLDNDARPEILFASPATGRHVAWLMNGTVAVGGGFISPDPSSPDWQLATVHDVDGDQRNDLAFWNRVTGAVEFWPMQGLTRSAAPLPLTGAVPLPPVWTPQASADFDHDGRSDLLWRNTATQALVIWKLNGAQFAGTLTPNPDHAVDANWQLVAALDVNDDGNVDLVFYNVTSGRVVQWLMDASVQRLAGRFTNPSSAGNANWKVVGAANYGGDSSPLVAWNDLLWRNATSGKLVVWRMNAQGDRLEGLFTTPDAPSNALAWQVVGPR